MIAVLSPRPCNTTALSTLITRYYPRIERLVRARLGLVRLARASIGDYVQDVSGRRSSVPATRNQVAPIRRPVKRG